MAASLSNGNEKLQGFFLLCSCFVCFISLASSAWSCGQISSHLSVNLATGRMDVVS